MKPNMKSVWVMALTAMCTLKATAQTKDPAHVIISPNATLSKLDTTFRGAISKWSNQALKEKDYKLIKAHPSAANFPGEVKPNYKFIDREVKITHQKISDALVPIVSKLDYSGQWSNNLYSTGLYAIAGEYIEITVPKGLNTQDMIVQIGAHSDRLDQWVAGKEDWRRMPLVVKKEELKTGTHRFASPFGGLIYIGYPPRGENWEATFKITHAIASPRFILGVTTAEAWKKQLQDNKAPWGELATKNVIITVMDSVLQKVTDPEHTMKLWDLIIEGEMDLAQIPLPFYRAQRFVVDEHIGGGFMHSGYPMMVHHSPSRKMISADVIANPELLMKPSGGGANWGFFHEIGHNMQNMDWVFGGTTEVSNNLFSLYMFDRLVRGRDNSHTAISNANTQKILKSYFAEGPSYEKWKKDPWTGLTTFRQLQEGFGWETFKTFFRAYHKLPFKNGRAKDQEKIDFFVKTFSQSAKRNVAPFFIQWGIPVSESVAKELEILPGWMPFNFPPLN